jgi:AcrR family transcriptional regulator
MTSQALRSESTRRNLVAVARAEFAARGYADAATEHIVKAAKLTRGALYHHYKDKRELFCAVVEDIGREVAALMDARAASKTTPWEALLAGCLAFIEMSARPDVQRIYLQDAPAVVGWPEWRKIDQAGAIGFLERTLARGLAGAARAREGTPAVLAHMIAGALRAAARSIPNADDAKKAKAEIDRATLILLMGLREQYAPET